MVKFLAGILDVVLGLTSLLLTLFARLCGIFAGIPLMVGLISMGIAGWGFGVPSVLPYLSVVWKVYVGLTLFAALFFLTFRFQHSCAGIRTFTSYLLTWDRKALLSDLRDALFWPITLARFGYSLNGWGMSLTDAFYNAFRYWFIDSWRGILCVFTIRRADRGVVRGSFRVKPS